jgi:hypothetical protein
MDARVKGYLVTGGVVVVTLVVLRFIAGTSIPVVSSIAKMALGTNTAVATTG